MNYYELTLFAQSAAAQDEPSIFGMLLPMILMIAGFWFLIIQPQRKKQKQHEQMVQSLKNGDEIVSTGGMYGTITNVKDDRFVVKIADNTKVELTKNAVASVQNQETKESKESS